MLPRDVQADNHGHHDVHDGGEANATPAAPTEAAPAGLIWCYSDAGGWRQVPQPWPPGGDEEAALRHAGYHLADQLGHEDGGLSADWYEHDDRQRHVIVILTPSFVHPVFVATLPDLLSLLGGLALALALASADAERYVRQLAADRRKGKWLVRRPATKPSVTANGATPAAATAPPGWRAARRGDANCN